MSVVKVEETIGGTKALPEPYKDRVSRFSLHRVVQLYPVTHKSFRSTRPSPKVHSDGLKRILRKSAYIVEWEVEFCLEIFQSMAGGEERKVRTIISCDDLRPAEAYSHSLH